MPAAFGLDEFVASWNGQLERKERLVVYRIDTAGRLEPLPDTYDLPGNAGWILPVKTT